METADRFNGRVEDYERYRLRYPAAVLEVLRERCGLRTGYQVADIGAGTGMLAELLLEGGCEVTAVEPNAEMRAACERLESRFAGLRVIDASAEATGLMKGAFDMVSAGRAFHWFDATRALPEFERILRPGGWLVLVTHRRAQDHSERAREYERILLEHGKDYAAVRGQYRSFERLRPFGGSESVKVRIEGEQSLSLEAFLGQTQSLSVTPMPGEATYEDMQAALPAFFARWSEAGELIQETVCEIVGWRTPGA